MEGSFLAADFPLPSPKSQTLPAYRRIGVCLRSFPGGRFADNIARLLAGFFDA
jgi:hypothetical protein